MQTFEQLLFWLLNIVCNGELHGLTKAGCYTPSVALVCTRYTTVQSWKV